MAQYNKSLGRFHLDGIAPARRGVPQIEVTFDIDANGIVNVSAKDLGTGREQNITITASANLSKEDIEKAVKEAEQYAEEDTKRREEADTRNHADQLVYQSEKTLDDMGDKIESSDKESIQAAIEKVKTALSGTETEPIKQAVDELEKAFYAVSEKLYSQVTPPEGGSPDGSHGSYEEFVDAEYEVVDDDENL